MCIEDKRSISLADCDQTENNAFMNGNNVFLDTVIINQSMSGDAESGEACFTMPGGNLTCKSAHMFHVPAFC